MHTHDGVACMKEALAFVGDKWTPIILYCLANEPSVRFVQLQDRVQGINPRTLSARLAKLECGGIIEKIPRTEGHRTEYRLTEKGNDLLPTVVCMHEWWHKYRDSSVKPQ